MSTWHVTGDVETFGRAATGFLEAEPCSRNVIRWIMELARGGGSGWAAPPRFLWFGDSRSAQGAATWTPPFNLRVSELPQGAAAGLVESLRAELSESGAQVAGVGGPEAAARAVAAAWEAATGDVAEVHMEETLYELRAARDVPLPPGRRRPADPREALRLLRWLQAFSAEVGLPIGHDAAALVRGMIASGQLDVWADERDAPVAMAGHRHPVAGVVRVGPVYTPPSQRGRGYARRLVAEISAAALAEHGVRRCMLFADIANPVSNAIYRQAGYEPVERHLDITFTSPRRLARRGDDARR